jgi:hypothetical protein
MKHKATTEKPKQTVATRIAFVFGLLLTPALVAVFLYTGIGQQAQQSVYNALPGHTKLMDGANGVIDADHFLDDGKQEERWKAGQNITPAPKSIPAGAFLDGLSVNDYFHKLKVSEPDVKVVVTKDARYNCGMSELSGMMAPDQQIAGCYNREYGKVIFIWWGAKSDEMTRKLVLLHEYSHFHQNYDHFNAVFSATQDLNLNRDKLSKILETDATCRVYYQWKYVSLENRDQFTASPCGDTKWTPDYLEKQFTANGVKIRQW